MASHNHHNHARQHRLLVVAVVSLAAGSALGLALLLSFGHIRTPKSISLGGPNVGRVGQYVHAGELKVQVSQVTIDKVGQQPFLPGDGREFYILRVKIGNLSDATRWVTPVTEAYLADNAGHKYQMEPAPLAVAFEAGGLAPDETRTGDISFSVPQSAHGLKFVYKDELALGTEPVEIDLGH